MVRRIPYSIKVEVLKQWLKGVSRDQIATNNDIAFGSVSNVIKEIRDKDIPDIDLLREVALALKEEGLEPIQFARSMRLNKSLDNLGMSEEQIENFLEHLSVFFYKNDVGDIENFLIEIESVSDLVEGLDLSIYDIREYIIDKQAELNSLIIDIIQIKLRIEQAKSEFISTVKNTTIWRQVCMEITSS